MTEPTPDAGGSGSSSVSWPSYELPEPEFMHAVGVVVMNFNALELWLKLLYRVYVKLPDEAQALLFARQDNTARLALLKACFDGSDHTDEIKESLRHFVTGYSACAENRNILMHARIAAFESYPKKTQQMVWLSKNPKNAPLNENYYQPTLSDIRRIADDMDNLSGFASQLITFIDEKHQLPWLHGHVLGLKRNVSLPSKLDVSGILHPLSQ